MPKKVKKSVKENSQYAQLKKKWLKKHKEFRREVRQKHREAFEWIGEKVPAKEHVAGVAVGALMLTNALPATIAAASLPEATATPQAQDLHVDKTELVVEHLASMLPKDVRPLSQTEEALIGQTLSSDFGFAVSAELEGRRLNRSYGFIGAEQHLMRYPGDLMHAHLSAQEAGNKYIYSSGMAPGRGAWGYFAKSKAEMAGQDVEREKWYIAAPTFLAPGFMDNVKAHYEWFKYRKMLVLNPKTGRSVVVDIGDAGPAQWTGKHLGGSPEVMMALGLHTGSRKGGVLYFFVEDADNKIPFGPVKAGDYNLMTNDK